MANLLYENPDNSSYIKKSMRSGLEFIEYYKNGLFYSGIYPEAPLKISFTLIPTIYSLIHTSKRVLILGTGTGGLAIQLKELNSDCMITTVDIDENVEHLAKTYFGLERYPDVHFVSENAITYVAQSDQKFDYIIIDIFDGDKIPAGIISQNFINQLEGLLEQDGMIAINTNMRELRMLTPYAIGVNPMKYIYNLVFNSGFKAIFQNDFHNSGWLFAFKQGKNLKDLKDIFFEKFLEVQDIFQKCGIAIQLLFLSQIDREEVRNTEFVHTAEYKSDIISQYRQYIFKSVISLSRIKVNNNISEQELREATVRSLIRRIKDTLSSEAGKDFFKSKDEVYYQELNDIGMKMTNKQQISLYLKEILLPNDVELAIFSLPTEKSFFLKLVYALGWYLRDDCEQAAIIIEAVHTLYDPSCQAVNN
ncbi:spermidine synthase [Paenibacillus agilis]|uniref:Methyltransferase domain-containing protein n=1 Tax=Paenibacillus agilis TaxID=3020863 RepID=A0A559J110_9BACL|nr:methyltransferase domain-containing protein [Paenibacillus agilis]TVX93570.1 methyltransferase domain-containing protein [Paenibacillus agilis]